MIKIDLITGFLGSGKTTFIKNYVKYLKSLGEKICLIENDFGAVNVDTMLVNDLGVDIEMVSGGCDYQCHFRRYKTKLITCAMKGYTRVIVEPSGVYDTDEFFDVLYEEPVNKFYEIGNIFCLYDIDTKGLSYESQYIFVSEASVCSKLIVTKRDNKNIEVDLNYINQMMEKFQCNRRFSNKDIVYNDKFDFKDIINSGYRQYDHIKIQVINENNYDSLYILDKDISLNKIQSIFLKLFNDNTFGNIIRIKGFIYNDNKWYDINLTKNNFEINEIELGQKVIIVIGEKINKKMVEDLFNL